MNSIIRMAGRSTSSTSLYRHHPNIMQISKNISGQQHPRHMSKKSKASGKAWLLKQINDPFVRLREKRGLRSRSAFKLEELDNRFELFKKGGLRVVDLGAAPGGWLQIVKEKVLNGHIVGLDLLEIEPIEGVKMIKGDFTLPSIREELNELVSHKKLDVVLSDMSPSFYGDSEGDHSAQVHLVYKALEFAALTLHPRRGKFVAKVIAGSQQHKLERAFRRTFKNVSSYKPRSSRQQSSEFFMYGDKLRANPDPYEEVNYDEMRKHEAKLAKSRSI